jgi:TatD DNase family protein
MFVETDSPFLTPVPHRGKRNEPAYVRLVAETVASVKNISLEDVARVTTENVQNLFKI